MPAIQDTCHKLAELAFSHDDEATNGDVQKLALYLEQTVEDWMCDYYGGHDEESGVKNVA